MRLPRSAWAGSEMRHCGDFSQFASSSNYSLHSVFEKTTGESGCKGTTVSVGTLARGAQFSFPKVVRDLTTLR